MSFLSLAYFVSTSLLVDAEGQNSLPYSDADVVHDKYNYETVRDEDW